MFASPFWRPLVLASSCTVALVAVFLATAPPEARVDRAGSFPTEPEAITHELRLPPDAPAPHPHPGQVAVCEEPGRDEIVTLPDSGASEEGRPLWIRRPPGPDSADLPVLYLLHGATSTHETLRDQEIGPLLDRQMCRTGVEFVLAVPYGQEEGGATTEWADAADGSFALESFVTDAVIDAVEGEHTRPNSLRAIGGFSMGGHGAATLALRNPDLYSQVVGWAGYYRVDDPHEVLGGDTAPHSPDRLLDSADVRHLRFLLVEGTEERAPLQEGSIQGEAGRFADLLTEQGMTVATVHPRGGHDFRAWKRSFPQVMDFLVSGWSATP